MACAGNGDDCDVLVVKLLQHLDRERDRLSMMKNDEFSGHTIANYAHARMNYERDGEQCWLRCNALVASFDFGLPRLYRVRDDGVVSLNAAFIGSGQKPARNCFINNYTANLADLDVVNVAKRAFALAAAADPKTGGYFSVRCIGPLGVDGFGESERIGDLLQQFSLKAASKLLPPRPSRDHPQRSHARSPPTFT